VCQRADEIQVKWNLLFWGTYFEIVEIVPSIENACALYYEVDFMAQHTI
jgi:hypothetical protein